MVGFEYHIHIHAPDATTKQLGDTLHIDIDFESHSGMSVHHVNVRIYDAITGVEVYSKPDDPHVNDGEAEYAFEDSVVLSAANGFFVQSAYTMKARVWAHESGLEEETQALNFLVVE